MKALHSSGMRALTASSCTPQLRVCIHQRHAAAHRMVSVSAGWYDGLDDDDPNAPEQPSSSNSRIQGFPSRSNTGRPDRGSSRGGRGSSRGRFESWEDRSDWPRAGSRDGSRRDSSSRGGRGGSGRGQGPARGGRPSAAGQVATAPRSKAAGLDSSSRDTFESMHSRLQKGLAESNVIRKEAWERLFSLMRTQEDAKTVLELLRADAKVREATGFDWVTNGYGQTLLALVSAAGAVGAASIAERLLDPEVAQELHVNTASKELVGSFMRKLIASGADIEELVDPLERLYDRERDMRGRNTHMATHELSRAYRKAEDVEGVLAILEQAKSGETDAKPDLLEDLEAWLEKRGRL